MSTSELSAGLHLIRDDGPPPMQIEPPFRMNQPKFWHNPEVSGGVILESMRRRLGWPNYAGKRVLDLGCGVRIARTIANLGLEFGRYVGVDVNGEAIAWLQTNLVDPRFEFAHLNAHNPLYGKSGVPMQEVRSLPVRGPFDLACMFSVITHQDPDEALRTFELLRPLAARLYFTVTLAAEIDSHIESEPDRPRLHVYFNPDLLLSLVERSGWQVERIYDRSHYQQHVVIAS